LIQLQDCAEAAGLREARTALDFDLARQLAGEYGTPLLVVSRSRLIDTYHSMRQALPGVDLYYAAKSNSDLNILSTLCAENAFVDICS